MYVRMYVCVYTLTHTQYHERTAVDVLENRYVQAASIYIHSRAGAIGTATTAAVPLFATSLT